MAFSSINPATGKTLASYEEPTAVAVEEAIAEAHEDWRKWRRRDFTDRAKLMHAAAGILRDRAQDYGRLMAEEMGKSIRQGSRGAEMCRDLRLFRRQC